MVDPTRWEPLERLLSKGIRADDDEMARDQMLFALLHDPLISARYTAEEAAAIARHVPWTRRVAEGNTVRLDVDATMAQAQRAGATLTMPAQDMFWGDRYGQLRDPFGHHWSVATHVQDLTPEQIQANLARMAPNAECGGG